MRKHTIVEMCSPVAGCAIFYCLCCTLNAVVFRVSRLAQVDGSSGTSMPMPGAMLMIPTGHPEELGLVLYSLIMKASLAPRHVAVIL